MRRMRALLAAGLLVLVLPRTAAAHSYTDPALRTVLDGIQPTALPASVGVAVVPSVVDELVLTNPTSTPLEVLDGAGRPWLRISRAGVFADLDVPDWYLTGVPEGAVVPAGLGTAPRWARVSTGSTWSEFDPRLHPPVTATAAQRTAGKDAVLATWSVPLRYGGRAFAATGHVLFSPVRGGLVVAVTDAPPGVTATPLQGELPGLFLRAAQPLTVIGSDGRPFLVFDGTAWTVDPRSASWVTDRRAHGVQPGRGATTGAGTVVARGPAYSWLDDRLRYPHDQPPAGALSRTSVVLRWRVPLVVGGRSSSLAGTVTWVPRSAALHRSEGSGGSRWPWVLGGAAVLGGLGGATWSVRRSRGEAA